MSVRVHMSFFKHWRGTTITGSWYCTCVHSVGLDQFLNMHPRCGAHITIRMWTSWNRSKATMFTRRLYRRCRLTYTESNLRGEFLALSALVQRRQRADLTMCWKLLHGKLNQSHAELLTLAGDRLSGPSTRSNGYKLAVQRSRLDVRKFFFSCRVARVWNRLPAIVVSSNTVAAFKVRLDELQPP